MSFSSEFKPLALKDLRREAAYMKAEGQRFIQTHCVNNDGSVDIIYSFMKEGHVTNYKISGVTASDIVPSITDLFLAAFVFENEARELFGVNMGVIAVDFQGAMYDPAEINPMTFITPEQKAAKEKARAAAAKAAAKDNGGAGGTNEDTGSGAGNAPRSFVMTAELKARLDEKMPKLSAEKQAKVQAALDRIAQNSAVPESPEEAREVAREQGAALAQETPAEIAQDKAFVEKVESDPNLAASLPIDKSLSKDLEALEGRPPKGADGLDAPASLFADESLEQMLSLMDESKAAVVKAALSTKKGE